jgi:hypothetical protein
LRWAFIFLIALVLFSSAPGYAGPRVKTARFGEWHARLGPLIADAKTQLVAARRGRTILRRELRPWPRATRIAFRELNTDASAPELLVWRHMGGVHCCVTLDVYVFAARARPIRVSKNFGNPGTALRRIGTKLLLVSGDNRFAYAFTSYADSSWPVRVYELIGTRLVDVTRRHHPLVRSEAQRQWRYYLEFVRSGRDARGVLAAWAADECLLGREAYVRRVLPGAVRRMKPSYAFGGPHGAAYVRALWQFLTRTGYARVG